MPFNKTSIVTILPADLIAAVKACQNNSAEELYAQIRKQDECYREYHVKGLHHFELAIDLLPQPYPLVSDIYKNHSYNLMPFLVETFQIQKGVFYSLKQFRDALFAINSDDNPDHAHRGICDQLEARIDYDHCYNYLTWILSDQNEPLFRISDWLREQFQLWPEFSGDLHYPVPAPDGSSPMMYFQYRADEDNLWNFEYGKSRKRLLRFLQEQFSKEFPDV